jgi:hypothetical protein
MGSPSVDSILTFLTSDSKSRDWTIDGSSLGWFEGLSEGKHMGKNWAEMKVEC